MNARSFLTLAVATALAVVAYPATPAAAQTACDETVRQQFLTEVEDGATEAKLEAGYAQCRQNLEPPVCSTQTAELAGFGLDEKTKTVTNNGSIFYERMNGCGYHPQAETLACDVEVRQRFGYGGFPGGSNEHVLFCLDCNRDGAWDYASLGSVHVTDDVSGGPLSFYFNVSATTWAAPLRNPNTPPPNFVNCTVNNGAAIDVKAVLSWALRPDPVNLTSCYTFRPFWGNSFVFTARNDP
jgi:hypothetical protein